MGSLLFGALMILTIGNVQMKPVPLSLYMRSGLPVSVLKGRHFVNLNHDNSLRQAQVETTAQRLRTLNPESQRSSLKKIAWNRPALWFVGADYSHQQLDIVGAWFIQQWLRENYRAVDNGLFNGAAKFHTIDGSFDDKVFRPQKSSGVTITVPKMLVLNGIYNNMESARRGKVHDILGMASDSFVVVLIRGSDPLEFAYNELSYLSARYLYLNPEASSKWKNS